MTAIRSLDRRAWYAIALAVSLVVLFVHFSDAEAAPKSKAPRVHFVECAPGGVHAWVTEDGGIAVLPAGTECE